MTQVTDITGIGPAKAETLEEEGYGTVEEIAEADRETLAAVDGVGEDRALEFIVGASDLLEEGQEEELEEEEDGDEFDLKPSEVADEINGEDEEEEDEDEPVEDESVEEESNEEDSYTVDINFETRLQYHTFHAAIMRYHENIYSSNQPYSQAMQKILDGFTDYDSLSYELSEEELNTLHTAVKQARTSYQGNNLIDHMDALNVVEEQINDQRREYLF